MGSQAEDVPGSPRYQSVSPGWPSYCPVSTRYNPGVLLRNMYAPVSLPHRPVAPMQPPEPMTEDGSIALSSRTLTPNETTTTGVNTTSDINNIASSATSSELPLEVTMHDADAAALEAILNSIHYRNTSKHVTNTIKYVTEDPGMLLRIGKMANKYGFVGALKFAAQDWIEFAAAEATEEPESSPYAMWQLAMASCWLDYDKGFETATRALLYSCGWSYLQLRDECVDDDSDITDMNLIPEYMMGRFEAMLEERRGQLRLCPHVMNKRDWTSREIVTSWMGGLGLGDGGQGRNTTTTTGNGSAAWQVSIEEAIEAVTPCRNWSISEESYILAKHAAESLRGDVRGLSLASVRCE
ncbi:hypothetical protein B0H66DRAFT_604346 [Apodospora peruviana]|uniref:Uncharacterized protein n=1 Tax=Apodospora peruviana TaxID=516989 RepID=A0AAE0M260_9PEZI|nr:hypothetical protein B0H66DRAFT_604346 [Apodospora peruviana]